MRHLALLLIVPIAGPAAWAANNTPIWVSILSLPALWHALAAVLAMGLLWFWSCHRHEPLPVPVRTRHPTRDQTNR